jgi:peptidyl-prolyl cis-trans isomerase C
VPALDDVKAPLTQQLQQQNLKKTFDDLKAKAKIEITAVVPAAPASAAAASPAATPAPVAAPAEAAKK